MFQFHVSRLTIDRRSRLWVFTDSNRYITDTIPKNACDTTISYPRRSNKINATFRNLENFDAKTPNKIAGWHRLFNDHQQDSVEIGSGLSHVCARRDGAVVCCFTKVYLISI